jgi:hypothetical protein
MKENFMLLSPKPTCFDFFSTLFPQSIRDISIVPDDFDIFISFELFEHFIDLESVVLIGDFDIIFRYVFETSLFYLISSSLERLAYFCEFCSVSIDSSLSSFDRIVLCRGFHDRHLQFFST